MRPERSQQSVELQPMKKLVARFVKDESGATAIEYGLIAAGIALAIVTAMASATTNSRTADLPIVVPSEVAGIVQPKLPKFVPCLSRARKPLNHFQPSPKEAGRAARPKDNAIIRCSWPAFGG